MRRLPVPHRAHPARSFKIFSMKLGELASRLGAELRGNPELEITGIKGIEVAGPTEITFVANPRYTGLARTTRAAAVSSSPNFRRSPPPPSASGTLISPSRTPSPSSTSRPLIRPAFIPPPSLTPPPKSATARTSAPTRSSARVRLGPHATLLPHVVLYPGVQAGSHFFAHAHAVVRENCILGEHVTLENGVIVGADGFGFSKNQPAIGKRSPNPAPCASAAAWTFKPTPPSIAPPSANRNRRRHQSRQPRPGRPRLPRRRKHAALRANRPRRLFRHRQQRHPRRPGRHRRPLLGRRGAILTAQSAVSHDVPPGKMISGSPGFDNRIWLRAVALFQRLPELAKRLNRLEKQFAKEAAKEVAKQPPRPIPRGSSVTRRSEQGMTSRFARAKGFSPLSSTPFCSPLPPATPTTSMRPSKIAPALPSSSSKSITPAPASASTSSPLARSSTIASRSAAAARSSSPTHPPASKQVQLDRSRHSRRPAGAARNRALARRQG